MASDLSSGCTEVIEILDEKEEGEISLEDVSSSEEGQLNDGCSSRRRAAGQCPSCLSTKHCAAWCARPTRTYRSKGSTKKDAVQEKENCHNTKDSGYPGSKHPASTLQENNNDLIPISSDSDMEIVGLADNVKQITLPAKSAKVRKRKRKRRSQNASATAENPQDLARANFIAESSLSTKRDSQVLKDNHLPRVRHRESNSPHKPLGSAFTRSRMAKSPLRRHRSPVLRKSPIRRPRSPPRRSPLQSPVRSPTRRQFRTSSSPPNPQIDTPGNLNKLLKKVRQLKTLGTHSAIRSSGRREARGASLKDKLNNMMKGSDVSDHGSSETGKDNGDKKYSENDDEEDLALLRKMALETKPKRNKKDDEFSQERKETGCENNNEDDDVEDLELRVIALRSAMLKKHNDRMQRGVMPGKARKPADLARGNTESPFSQSFLDSIPIPAGDGEEEFTTPPSTPIQGLNENTNPEDMELDSEVELEKKKEEEPYSPTDDVSRQITIDSELLGIEVLDVSFGNQTSQTAVTPNASSFQTQRNERIEIIKIPENDSFLSSQTTYYSSTNILPSSQSPTSSLYSPTNATDTLEHNFNTRTDENLPAAPYSPSQPIDTPDIYFSPQDNPFFHSDPSQIPDTPYSPTDTPIYDIDLNTPTLLLDAPPPFQEIDTVSKPVVKTLREKEGTKNRNSKHQSVLIQIDLTSTNVFKPVGSNVVADSILTEQVLQSTICPEKNELEPDDRSETSSMKPDVGSALNSSTNSPEDTMIAVDDLPETDLDGSPLVFVTRDIEIHIPASSITQEKSTLVKEPLYLQGVPDVTKDANKIPTLVNRSLVPASILKSNKNLQQPLPQKKSEAHLEPAFRSAQMQPVQISTETTKTNRMFKPIKLAPVMKKPQLRIVTPSAFNCSSSDNSVMEGTEKTENIKAPLPTSRNEANNLFEDIHAPSKSWETLEVAQPGNSLKIAQPVLANPEPQSNAVQDRVKKNETSRDAAKNIEENSGKEKKMRSRRSKSNRSRSKHVAKTVKDDKKAESNDTLANVSKVTINEGEKRTGITDVSSVHKQSSNSNKTNQRHGSQNPGEKKRSLREKLKKPTPDKSKRDRDERRDRRSGHKSDRMSNNYKKTDANKLDDRRVGTKKQQKGMEVLDGTKSTQDGSISVGHAENSLDPETIYDSTVKHSKTNSQNQENTLAANTDVSIAATKSGENSASVSTQDDEDSATKNKECKKLEPNKRRRSSLEDDEEALRAILLASLAKRSKPSEPAGIAPKTPLAELSQSSVNTSTESVKGLSNTPGVKVSVDSVYSSSSDATPPALAQNNSTLIKSHDQNVNSSSLVPQVKLPSPMIVENIVPKTTTPDQTAPVALSRKRSISASAKAPLKKIAKKAPISASTKVVNNAKKYQNTLVQKKLNLQKVAMITNAQKSLSRTNLHGNKIMDTGRTRSMITQPLSDTQRFVINLASDSESENETELPTKSVEETVGTNSSEPKPVLAIPMSEFEKSVDLFLKDVRKKQETAAAIKPSLKSPGIQKPASPATPGHRKSPILSTTPLAVRHLPVSLQEEYRRLKQQILEREKLKLHRVLVNNTGPLSPCSKSSTPPGPLSPASPIHSPTMSKQSHNAPTSSLSPMATSAKDSGSRSVTVQSSVKNSVSSTTTKVVSPVAVSKMNSPSIASIPNLSIQIPNETANINLGFKKSTNPYIPVSNSQARLVTAVTVNTKDSNSIVSVKDQSSLKNVQVQLKLGKTGRTVSLGETVNLKTKTNKNKESEAPEPPATKTLNVNSGGRDGNLGAGPSADSNQTQLDSVRVVDKCDNSVDSAASTLIISRDGENGENNTLADSSTSTIIIPRNENVDSGTEEVANVPSSKEKSAVTGTRKLKNNIETWEKVRGDVRKELDAISALPLSEQKTYLATVEQNLVKKRYAILDDLSEISGNLRQLKMEKEVQSNMASEVKKLQEQLKLAEERLEAQRARVSKMAPSISATYEKVNSGRRECVKMTRICLGLGCQVVGNNYKIPAAGAQLLNNRLKQVAGSTRQLSNKKTSGSVETNEEPRKIDGLNQTSSSENSNASPLSESMPSTICENSTVEAEETVAIDTVTIVESQENSNGEFAASIETDKTDIGDEETLKIDRITILPFGDSISKDSPQLTSTPNSSKESISVAKHVDDPGTSAPKFVLDNQRAGLSGNKNDGLEQRRILQPYKSVLEHLTVPRTADPSGILCPYELMGTCRDEDCQFVHQSARNG